MCDEEEWQVAGASRRRKAGRGGSGAPSHPQASPATTQPSTKPPTERQVARCCQLLDAAAAELTAAHFWAHLSQQLSALPPHCAIARLRHMVVYGLGSLEQLGAAHIRSQLAAAKLLAALLPLAAPAEAFDPVFTPLDHAALQHCGIQVIAANEGGRRLARQPTLFFMPHCEAQLTDALLAANVEAGTLANVVILGNCFSGYQLKWPPAAKQQQHAGGSGGGRIQGSSSGGGGGRRAGGASSAAAARGREAWEQLRPATMLRLCECGAVQELPVSECDFPVTSAFNNLGLHWFPPDWRARLQPASGSPADVSER